MFRVATTMTAALLAASLGVPEAAAQVQVRVEGETADRGGGWAFRGVFGATIGSPRRGVTWGRYKDRAILFGRRVVIVEPERRSLISPGVPSRVDTAETKGPSEPAPAPAAADPLGPTLQPVVIRDLSELEPGAVIPPDVPLVILRDWRGFGLDAPPGGQAYARIGDRILLVSVTGRQVMAVVDPAAEGD